MREKAGIEYLYWIEHIGIIYLTQGSLGADTFGEVGACLPRGVLSILHGGTAVLRELASGAEPLSFGNVTVPTYD